MSSFQQRKFAVLFSLVAFWLTAALQAQEDGLSIWVWIIIFIILFGGIALWGYRDQRAAAGRSPEIRAAAQTQAPVGQPDDLTLIEGIGPKIAQSLRAGGITTFHQLADTGETRLREILEKDGIRLFDAETWPEQARLAAAGDYTALKTLQDNLRAGRQV